MTVTNGWQLCWSSREGFGRLKGSRFFQGFCRKFTVIKCSNWNKNRLIETLIQKELVLRVSSYKKSLLAGKSTVKDIFLINFHFQVNKTIIRSFSVLSKISSTSVSLWFCSNQVVYPQLFAIKNDKKSSWNLFSSKFIAHCSSKPHSNFPKPKKDTKLH